MLDQLDQVQLQAEQRKLQIRRGIIFLVLALAFLLLAVLLFAFGAPEWNADGSRDAYSSFARSALCTCLIAGTMFVPASVRAFVLAMLPHRSLRLAMTIFIVATAAVVVPVEAWLALKVTDAEEPGEREKRDNSSDSDWD